MNKLISLFIISICLGFSSWAQKQDSPYKLSNFNHVGSYQMLYRYLKDNGWQNDFDGKPCALICVNFVNMPQEEIRNLTYNFSSNTKRPEAVVDSLESENHQMWVYVQASKNAIMEVVDSKGIKSNRLAGLTFKSKECYEVTLTSDKRQTINITTKPEGAIVKLDNEKTSDNGTFTDVRLGAHKIQVSVDGSVKLDTVIEVSDINNSFHFDVRPKKLVRIKTNPSGAYIKVNGEEVSQRSPVELLLPHDNYLIEAILSDTESDSKTITVNDLTNEVVLNPIKRKAFDVYAIYDGNTVKADLYVNGYPYKDQYGNEITGAQRYSFNEPIGAKLKMKMSYYSSTKERTIKVKENMDIDQIFDLQPRNPITWPWEREYDTDVSGVSVAYVRKQLVTKGYGEQLKENGFWNDGEGKWLNGVQMGVHFQPAFSWGLGLYTGLFYEIYLSFNDNYDYNEYAEHDLYLPIHAYYRIPFGDKIALKVHGGLGLSYAVAGILSQTDDSYGYEDITDVLGNDAYPNAFNMTLDIGVSFRIKNVQINASYCKGLNDHGSYHYLDSGYKSTQNKMSIGASWVIGTRGY